MGNLKISILWVVCRKTSSLGRGLFVLINRLIVRIGYLLSSVAHVDKVDI